ncbi:MAG: hypothetical protein FIB01_11985 [Gemmatimonadetes bacterium]|nr:hypothetical protein [Gemmatimonadota bacterium]
MKLSQVLVLHAIVALVFGIGFLLVPGTVVALYGATPGPEINLIAQFFGAALTHVGVFAWLARGVTDGPAQKAIILGFLIGDVVGLIVALIGTLSGVLNAVGWSAVAVYGVMTLLYANLQFMKPRQS